VILFSDNVMLARSQTNFELVKIGFEQQVAAVAREWSILYGLVVAAVALLFGWIASVIFRRD
jgi:Putative transmembrane protein (Alph_Pro_TM)